GGCAFGSGLARRAVAPPGLSREIGAESGEVAPESQRACVCGRRRFMNLGQRRRSGSLQARLGRVAIKEGRTRSTPMFKSLLAAAALAIAAPAAPALADHAGP